MSLIERDEPKRWIVHRAELADATNRRPAGEYTIVVNAGHYDRLAQQLAGAVEACGQAAFLFGALGHGGEHDDCDPCAFVRAHGPAGGAVGHE